MSQCIALLKNPELYLKTATSTQWTEFIDEARRHALLGTFFFRLTDAGYFSQLPLVVQTHLRSGFHYAEKQKMTLLNEMLELEQVFASATYPCVLVKGVAYRLGGYSFARGRVFSDIDLLIPPAYFQDALTRLHDAGYLEFALSDYDRRYYQNWSHQHPPLTHFLRGANIDLHHHIYPVSSKENILAEPIWDKSLALQHSAFQIPTASYLFVHAAVHLFYQDETHKLIKDLCDLFQLYQELPAAELKLILASAAQCQASTAVVYALDTLNWLFEIQIPADLFNQLQAQRRPFKQKLIRKVLTTLLQPQHYCYPLAHFIWFVRGHLLKMTPATLLYHTVAKTFEQFKEYKRFTRHQQQLDAESRPKDAVK